MGVRKRMAILAVILIAGGVAAFVARMIPAEQPVELELRAEQGTSSFTLAAENDAVSPGCGCSKPEVGKQHWQGMSIPSVGFDLDVEAEPSNDIADDLWSLSVFAPWIGPIDWYGMPAHSVWLRVVAVDSQGYRSTLFNGATSHMVIWSDETVSVRQPRAYPYAAILPAEGGTTSFSSYEAPRAQWGAQVDISSTSPARPAAALDEKYSNPHVGQRGPMVDILGRTVRFTIPYTNRTRIWTALKPLPRIHPGDRVHVAVTTPFALRLVPHPVQNDWQATLAKTESSSPLKQSLGGLSQGKNIRSPLGQDRLLLKEPLPTYSVRLSQVEAPSQEDWTSFAARSAEDEMIIGMMGDTWVDPLPTGNPWNEYALPPVTTHAQIGVFGRIKKFESTSVGGQAVIGSNSRPIPRGEKLEFISEMGLSAGAYRLTPLVSSGQETARASIFGSAKVWIGGDLASHLDWVPWSWFPLLIGAIAGIVLTELYYWWTRKSKSLAEE
jgi:hypothetical protein